LDKGPYTACFTPDGKEVLVLTQQVIPPPADDKLSGDKIVGKVITYKATTGDEVASKLLDDLADFDDKGKLYRFSTDGQWIFAGHFLRSAKIFNIASGECIASIPIKSFDSDAKVGDFSASAQLLVIGDGGGT